MSPGSVLITGMIRYHYKRESLTVILDYGECKIL